MVSTLAPQAATCAPRSSLTCGRGPNIRPRPLFISAQQAAAYYDATKSGGAYPTVDAFLADLVDLLRDEVAELIRLGCTYIQIDSPQYAALIDPGIREGYRQRGNDPDRLLDLSIEMDNAVIGGHPGIIFGLHLCRGNNQSKFYASGDYGPITKVFRQTKFQRFLLEFDDERSGGFEPLCSSSCGPDRRAGAGEFEETGAGEQRGTQDAAFERQRNSCRSSGSP